MYEKKKLYPALSSFSRSVDRQSARMSIMLTRLILTKGIFFIIGNN